jgi:DNA polymerase-1
MQTEKPHLRPTMMVHNNTTGILSEIECNGMPINVPVLETMGTTYKAKLEEIDFNLRDMLKVDDLNLQSKDELSAALYGGIIRRPDTEQVEKERWATKKVPFKFTYADGRTTMKERTERYREKYFVERKCVKEITLRGAGFKTDKSMKVKKEGYFKTGIEIIKNLTAGTAVRREIKKELIERAKISKLVSSVLGSEPGKGYVNKVQDDNKMHPRYNQSRTGTGRYSSKDPNGQNFPRSKEDQEGFLNPIKTVFIPTAPTNIVGPGRGLIASADLAQLEWRVAAYLSQDPVAMNEIMAGIDAHADNATRFFGDIKYRQDAKIMTFRLLYGGTAYSFFMDPLMPNFSKAKWQKIVQDYYTKYFVLAQWQAGNISLVNQNGGWYVSQFGRIYRFPLSQIKKNGGTYEGYKPTQIKNYEVQGTATGDIVPFAMYVVKQRMGSDYPNTKWIGQIHDAILFDTTVGEIKPLSDLVIQAFEDLPGLIKKMWGIDFNVPLTGDVEFGLNYGAMIHKAKRADIGAPTEFVYGKAA